MQNILHIIVPPLVAFLATIWIRPYILKVARAKNIVDNPDARKLQREPVPVLGGLTVVFGVLVGMMSMHLFDDFSGFFPAFAVIIIMLIIGLMDDMISLTPRVRFVAEIAIVLYLIYTTHCLLGNFHGLWGMGVIPYYIGVPLTVVACVGIINAINLIDGVDGYSSGYTIVSSLLFGGMFYSLGNHRMLTLSLIVAVALIPFFFCNVFGRRSKMFIGDAGTLSLGVIFSVFVTTLISAPTTQLVERPSLGLIPFSLAVLCIPVFDTLRVMSVRMVRGKSPFHPDKTHLHHLFIELGFSHIGTTISIISINLMVVLLWYLFYLFGLSIDVQFYLVIALGILVTFVFYPFMRRQINSNTPINRFFHHFGTATHFQNHRVWIRIQQFVDGKSKEEV